MYSTQTLYYVNTNFWIRLIAITQHNPDLHNYKPCVPMTLLAQYAICFKSVLNLQHTEALLSKQHLHHLRPSCLNTVGTNILELTVFIKRSYVTCYLLSYDPFKYSQ